MSRIFAFSALALCAAAYPALADESNTPDDTIVVTAAREPLSIAQSGSAVSVITGGQLETQQYAFTSDALRTVPGLSVNDTGGPGGVTSVFMRGLDGDDVKVLIDGIDVADPSATSEAFDFANLLSDEISRIEIVRGPQSVLYGSDAMGGVINITTKSGRSDPGETVTVQGGSYGTAQGSAAIRGVVGKFDYAVSIAGLNTDGIIAADQKNGNQELDPYDNITANTKLGLALSDALDLSAVFRFTQSDHNYPGFSFTTSLPADMPGQYQSIRQIFGRVQLASQFWDGRLKNVLAGTFGDTRRQYFLFDDLQDFFHSKTNGVEDQASLAVTDTLSLVAGGETRDEHYLDNTGFKADQRINGIYGEAVFIPMDNVSLTAGLRHDWVSGGASKTTYRVTGSARPFDDGPRLHASYGTGFKVPSLYELFIVSPFVLGDPSLQPETSRGWDVGLSQDLPWWHTSADSTWFYNDVHNLISGDFNDEGVFQYANLGHARTYGVENSLTSHPIDAIDLSVSYTWMQTHDLTDGGPLVRRPHHSFSGTVTWHPEADITLFTTVSWTGTREDDNFSPGGPPIAGLAPYALIRLGGSWQWTDNIKLFARIENLLNRHYEEALGYGVIGRAAYAGVTTNF